MALAPIQDHAAPPSGHFRLYALQRGVWVQIDDDPNIIVNGAKAVQARLIGGDVANRSITKIGFGTGTGAADATNASLTSAFVKALAGASYPAAGQVQFSFTLGAGEANGTAISEFGLYTAGDVLFARRVRGGPLQKESDVSLSGTWTITY